jgi:hypothetical protein
VTSSISSAFVLSDAAKADPALIGADERFFTDLADGLARSVAELEEQLAAVRRAEGRGGQAALERDQEVHRLTARLRTLRRFGLDLCLGRMVGDGTVYVGRLGIGDGSGRRLLLDWRSPAAEPFFAATHADPMGLVSRRRYRWAAGRVADYWDEVFDPDGLEGHAALDDQSAFVASLGASRSGRMRDVLGTIQSDQDAVIRAGSAGALVVDGGPGTGKTVVALHRAAYLLYSDPRLGHHRGGVLFVGPSRPYLAYVGDVLPSLGEEGVRTCTLRDLVAEGAAAGVEADGEVARLKERLVPAVEEAVRFYEEPPARVSVIGTPRAELRVRPEDWAEAFASVEPGTPHNEAREQVRSELAGILSDRYGADVAGPELTAAVDRAWPLIGAADLVADLWSVPAYLRRCAPWLTVAQVRRLQRVDPRAWTVSDLPLLDAARHRLGDPDAARRARRAESAVAAERVHRGRVVDELIAADDSELLVMSMLRGEDLRDALDDGVPAVDPDVLAGPFAHVVVDEAQELTDAEWQMLLVRCPSRSFTVVGDRAQARRGFGESWSQRLGRVGLGRVTVASLSINYRTPEEVMAQAEPVIRAVLPDANVPVSIRAGGVPVRYGSTSELGAVLAGWSGEGVACVIGDPGFAGSPRVRSLSPELAKGLEFDLVVLVDPQRWPAVDRYVAMTRATRELVVLTTR